MTFIKNKAFDILYNFVSKKEVFSINNNLPAINDPYWFNNYYTTKVVFDQDARMYFERLT